MMFSGNIYNDLNRINSYGENYNQVQNQINNFNPIQNMNNFNQMHRTAYYPNYTNISVENAKYIIYKCKSSSDFMKVGNFYEIKKNFINRVYIIAKTDFAIVKQTIAISVLVDYQAHIVYGPNAIRSQPQRGGSFLYAVFCGMVIGDWNVAGGPQASTSSSKMASKRRWRYIGKHLWQRLCHALLYNESPGLHAAGHRRLRLRPRAVRLPPLRRIVPEQRPGCCKSGQN